MNKQEERELQAAYNTVLRFTAAIIAGIFILAGIAEWVRITYAPFQGIAAHYKWMPGIRNYFYLMAMFNILIIRYIIMRIYIAPGEINFRTITGRLSRAAIASMCTSQLPCVYGLALFIMAGDLIDFYLLFGLSIIYSAIYFPRYKNWVSLIEEKMDKEESL